MPIDGSASQAASIPRAPTTIAEVLDALGNPKIGDTRVEVPCEIPAPRRLGEVLASQLPATYKPDAAK